MTTATAIVYCHRFYIDDNHSFKDYDKYDISTAALYLAIKVEETGGISMNDIVKYSHKIRDVNSSFPNDEIREKKKASLRRNEIMILNGMRFNMKIEHPHKYLLYYINTVQELFAGQFVDTELRNLTQIAWDFLNDSLKTTLCIQYYNRPKYIAYASIYLASMILKIDLPTENGENWLDTINVPAGEIESKIWT
eukprot:TRINITY_DN3990_c0_g1_i1.p1 TRINITY_DN3990_c0_g1~~TRINITY_DN3990_c0_g1_i1.p1  ORF type:complete len:194 (-),score=38.76 TRINITY_DN3990_c0_g1_i1:37-618(-)